jgi:hypothetical protein
VTANERELLVEQAASAYRPARVGGEIGMHPAWADLDEQGRAEAFDVATAMRRLEAAIDPEGLSSTARAVLERLR